MIYLPEYEETPEARFNKRVQEAEAICARRIMGAKYELARATFDAERRRVQERRAIALEEVKTVTDRKRLDL